MITQARLNFQLTGQTVGTTNHQVTGKIALANGLKFEIFKVRPIVQIDQVGGSAYEFNNFKHFSAYIYANSAEQQSSDQQTFDSSPQLARYDSMLLIPGMYNDFNREGNYPEYNVVCDVHDGDILFNTLLNGGDTFTINLGLDVQYKI